MRLRPRLDVPAPGVLAAAIVALIASSACDSSSGTDPNGPPAEVTSVPVDALIVMMRDDPSQRAFHLVDPSTGKTSAYEWYVPRVGDVIAIAPDGQRIAYATQTANGGTSSVVVAEAVMEAGLPTLHIDRQFDGLYVGSLHWSPDGDRLYTDEAWLDPASGDVHRCSDSPPSGGAVYPIVAFPGGHRYVCSSTSTLYDDGTWVGPAVGGFDEASADGQFYDKSLQVPSGSVRPFAPETDFDPLWAGSAANRLRLPDGRFVIAPIGSHGKAVAEEQATWVTLYRVVESDALPGDGQLYDYHDIFTTGVWQSHDETWPIGAALEPWFHDGDGRGYAPVGLTADGQSIIYKVDSYIITYATDGTNVIYETPMESALVEIRRDGTSRGFKTSSVADRFAYLDLTSLLDLGNGDWFASGSVALPNAGTHGAWLGYRGGKATAIMDSGMATPDGRWLYGVREATATAGPMHCFRDLHGDLAARCFPQANLGRPIGFMAQGLDPAHASDAPIVLGASRVAAWPGASVVVFGAHLGTSGTLTVGDVAVPAGDITAWSDRAITFTMSAALPESGRIGVTTAAGKGGADRALWLHRTVLAATPFDVLTRAPIELGQGLNVIDLGVAGLDAGGQQMPFAAAPDGVAGHYVVFSQGAATPTDLDLTLALDGYQHGLRVVLADHLADATKWQPVVSSGFDPTSQLVEFVNIAGELVERSNGGHLVVGPHLTLAQVSPKVPELLRPGVGGTWTSTSPGGPAAYPPWSVRLLTSFDGVAGQWGTPVFAATPTIQLPNFFRGVAADGQLMLFTGGDPLGAAGGAYIMSQDGGATLGATIAVASDLLSAGGALEEPLYVPAQSPFFLVFEASYGAPQVFGMHAIDRAGAFTPDVIDVPPDAQLAGGTLLSAPLTTATLGGKVLLHFATHTLVMADFDAADPAWTILPSAADRGHVRGFWEDPASHDLWAVKDDGTVLRATAAGGWSDFAVVDLGIALAATTRVVPAAVAKLADGRTLVLAALYDAAPGADAPSVAGRAAWLVSPLP